MPRLPPGPRSLVPGRFLRAMQRDPIPFFASLAREYGDASAFSVAPQRIVFFNHPDFVRELLVTQHQYLRRVILELPKALRADLKKWRAVLHLIRGAAAHDHFGCSSRAGGASFDTRFIKSCPPSAFAGRGGNANDTSNGAGDCCEAGAVVAT